MIKPKLLVFLSAIIILYSCNQGNREAIQSEAAVAFDTVQHKADNSVPDHSLPHLTFSIPDTITKSELHFFSNTNTKDSFILTVNPGLIKESKSELRIVTADNRVVYAQSFDSYYFFKNIYDADIVLPSGVQDTEEYRDKYWKSRTPEQVAAYFKKSLLEFFDDALYLIKEDRTKHFEGWEEDIDEKEFLNEVLTDPSIVLFDIVCFDCDEGGAIIGYSRKQQKVITLLDHD